MTRSLKLFVILFLCFYRFAAASGELIYADKG